MVVQRRFSYCFVVGQEEEGGLIYRHEQEDAEPERLSALSVSSTAFSIVSESSASAVPTASSTVTS
jgi:hypothetical protein